MFFNMRNGEDKMPIIKGPTKFKQGTKELAEFILSKTKLQVPFAATGWKSTKGMDLVPDEYKRKGDISTINIKPKKLNKKEIENVVYKEKSVAMKDDKPKKDTLVERVVKAVKPKPKKSKKRGGKSKK